MNLSQILLQLFGFGVITAANASYLGVGPTKTGEIVVDSIAGASAKVYYLTATFTGDAAASTSAVLNYIDGTQALPSVPAFFAWSRNGGTGTSTTEPISIVDNADGGKTATVTFSAAIGNGLTLPMAIKFGL